MSCYKQPKIEHYEPAGKKINEEDIIKALKFSADSIQTLIATGSGTYNGNLYAGDFEFEISWKNPERFYAIIRGPFGVELGRIWIKNDSLMFYISQNKTLYYFVNDSSFVYLGDFPEFSTLVPLLFGIVPVHTNKEISLFNDETNRLKFVKNSQKGIEIINLSYNGRLTINSYQLFTRDTLPIADFSYDSFGIYDGKFLPTSVTITDFRGGDWVQLRYKKFKINKKVDENLWKIALPEDITRRKIYR